MIEALCKFASSDQNNTYIDHEKNIVDALKKWDSYQKYNPRNFITKYRFFKYNRQRNKLQNVENKADNKLDNDNSNVVTIIVNKIKACDKFNHLCKTALTKSFTWKQWRKYLSEDDSLNKLQASLKKNDLNKNLPNNELEALILCNGLHKHILDNTKNENDIKKCITLHKKHLKKFYFLNNEILKNKTLNKEDINKWVYLYKQDLFGEQ